MKTSYLKQLIMQAYIKGYYLNRDSIYVSTISEIEAIAEDYANADIEFLDLTDKEEVA